MLEGSRFWGNFVKKLLKYYFDVKTIAYVANVVPHLVKIKFGSQIDTLTPDPCFRHNLCCKYSNESCEFILDIYVSRALQWYKKIFNSMNFNP